MYIDYPKPKTIFWVIFLSYGIFTLGQLFIKKDIDEDLVAAKFSKSKIEECKRKEFRKVLKSSGVYTRDGRNYDWSVSVNYLITGSDKDIITGLPTDAKKVEVSVLWVSPRKNTPKHFSMSTLVFKKTNE